MKPKLFELRKTVGFEAAHRLPNVPAGHKCGRLHGHSFRITLIVRGELGADSGWVIDYSDMKKVAAPVLDRLDHHYLNDIKGLENPTSEVIAQWTYNELKSVLPLLHRVIIEETCTSECRYPVE